jgi:hypothetical protein
MVRQRARARCSPSTVMRRAFGNDQTRGIDDDRTVDANAAGANRRGRLGA